MLKKTLSIIAAILVFVFLPGKILASDFTLPPSKIIIPSLNISLPVTTVKIAEDETWEVSYQSASYGELTALPGNHGNTIIFAHALPSLFRQLPEIKNGDLIHLFTQDDWFTYQVKDTLITNPANLNILKESRENQLILYTCTGDNWQQRFIVRAEIIY